MNLHASKGFSSDSLLSSLPDIRRARGWRLYTADGDRLLSLWSDFGRTLLGYTPRGLTRHVKSALDRGLSTPFPGSWNDRIARMTRDLYPEYACIRLRGSVEHMFRFERTRFLFDHYLRDRHIEQAPGGETPAAAGGKMTSSPPAHAAPPQAASVLPKSAPSVPVPAPWSEPVRIILPIPEALSTGILAYSAKPLDGIEDELIDGIRGACAIFALSLVRSEQASGTLSARFEESWRRFDHCGIELFARSGPWLTPKYPRDAHRELFAYCAARGVLISPEYDFPSSVPGDFNEGELHCLHKAASIFL